MIEFVIDFFVNKLADFNVAWKAEIEEEIESVMDENWDNWKQVGKHLFLVIINSTEHHFSQL